MKLKDKPYYLFLLALLSGFLFWLGWPTKPLPQFLFLAFVPLLAIEDHLAASSLKNKALKFLGYSYLCLLTWNVLTTYWIYNATPVGGLLAMILNAALMCVPLMLFYFTRRFTNNFIGYTSFIAYWLAFEYWHLNWSMSWPWLTLGNAFASTPFLVQWYEYTGALGGSLWILAMNVLAYRIYQWRKDVMQRKKVLIATLALVVIPGIISVIMYSNWKEQGTDVEVVVVQPNIDPYEEKFKGNSRFIPYDVQLKRLISLSESKITPATTYVAWPETALPKGYDVETISQFEVIDTLKSFLKRHPQISLVTGLDTYKIYSRKETTSAIPWGNQYYDSFNSAMQIDQDKNITLYHKSKLVPGVEYMPPAFTSFAIAMGESAGGLGMSNERVVFTNNKGNAIAPVICYESIFGEFVTEYVQKGAKLIFIITNDGWWGNTQGHKQHIQYASLRAIETRKSIARSANTGISGFINQRGDILEKSVYWKQDVMRMKIKQNDIETFYTSYGDYIGKAGLILALLIFFFAIYSVVKFRISGNRS